LAHHKFINNIRFKIKMQIKGVLLGLVLFTFILIIINSADSAFLGTCEGYVFNSSSPVPGATVNITVDNCTSQNCWQTTTSDSGGYFVVINLKLDKNGNVTVYANKSSVCGSNTGTADNYHAAYVNVSLNTACGNNPPSAPALTDQAHTTAASVALTWTSGTDPENHTTYDEYRFNYTGIITNATSPQVESLSGIGFLTWEVRTCDIYGACSAWIQDTFIHYECPPCVCPPSGGGGGGRRVSGIKYENVTVEPCPEEWVCEEWSPCIYIPSEHQNIWDYEKQGIQIRECADIANCGTTCMKPPTWQYCEPPVRPELELPVFFAIPWWIIILTIGFGGGLIACGVYIKKLLKIQNEYQKTSYYKRWVKSLRKKHK